MPLINCKCELKLKWRNHCILSNLGANDTNVNPINIIFTIKDIKLHDSVITLSEKHNKNYQNLLVVGNRQTWDSFFKGIGKFSKPITMRPFFTLIFVFKKRTTLSFAPQIISLGS